ncbi:MAG: cobaltochelatase subunit CobN [Hyphomicrobium sp.]|nr:cobaltochelatase subunit CobN [Hyphomicrobium sp.]
MHLLVRESSGLDEAAPAEDLGLAPADLVVLSFSDSDLTTFAAAWHGNSKRSAAAQQPTLRLAHLARLRHPMSVDLLCETTLPGTKAVLVRLLGGLDYWRYGCEQLESACRRLGIVLAIVAGDGRPDPRLPGYATVGAADLRAIEALLDAGGAENVRAAGYSLIARAEGGTDPIKAPDAIPNFGLYRAETASAACSAGHCVIVFYRSFVLAGDTLPIDAMVDALVARGMSATALYVPSLKAPDAAAWLRAELHLSKPDVILNTTAFAANDAEQGSPLNAADCPVLQLIMSLLSQMAWSASGRGLSAADLAMHVALPEIDGRLTTGAISFKQQDAAMTDGEPICGFTPMLHHPHADGIAHAADLAAAWARLRRTAVCDRTVALVLSTYPGRADQIAHAVGLDGPESAAEIFRTLAASGYRADGVPTTGRAVIDALTTDDHIEYPVASYLAALASLPQAFADTVMAAWGDPLADPSCKNGHFRLPIRRYANVLLALQPERGETGDRKAGYHDPSTPPRHAYVAFYLWLRHVANIDALVHLGAHGTVEWLPGKAVALSASCAPRAVLGPLPVVYPFIVNDPGEAAQAKRRIGAVTIGHRTPPIIKTELDDAMLDVERLVDEFSSADGLDPRRRDYLVQAISDAVDRAGLTTACGLTPDMDNRQKLAKIDAFLCDIKELSIRDGLHVLDGTETSSILRALDGRFIQPGPSGAPSRGRADVLPTGRNLFSVDPRGVPTPTAMANGERAACAIMGRYAEDHGEWPKSIILDLWGSATLRTGGEELATALALLGVKPTWDSGSFRVSGFEIVAAARLDRPRVDVTLRISGLFRDMFPTQLTLFDAAVQRVRALDEDGDSNPLASSSFDGNTARIFGAADGAYGTGVMALIDRGDWQDAAELGETYLRSSTTAYHGDGSSADMGNAFCDRVRMADAFVHVQDHHETDILTGGDFAAHEGGFAAAAAALGNAAVALYHGDTGRPDQPKIRTLDEECARIVSGRAASPRWIAGQMRHGFRGAAEFAATVDAAFAFAATSGAVTSAAFETLYNSYVGREDVADFIQRENPAAFAAMTARFEEAIARGLWRPRRNDLSPMLGQAIAEAAQ